MQQATTHSILPLIFWSLLIGFFLYECWLGYLAHLSTEWPAAKATILEATVEESYVKNRGRVYKPKIRYKYRVGSKVYECGRIDFRATTFGYFSIDKVMEGYIVGDDIIVFYDPKKPGNAVIKNGFGKDHLLAPIILLAAMFITYWMTH